MKNANTKISSHAERSNSKPLSHSLNYFTDLYTDDKLFLCPRPLDYQKSKVRFNMNFKHRFLTILK